MPESNIISRITYPSTDGTTTTFNFPFEVLSPTDVRVELDGVNIPQTGTLPGNLNPWSLNSLVTPTQVVFDSAPTAGQELVIFRQTDRTQIYKTYTNEPLDADDLNKSFKQLVFIEQEAYDYVEEVNDAIGDGPSTNVPEPTESQANDHFLVTDTEQWTIKNAAEVKDILGFGIDDTLTVNNIEAAGYVSSMELSGTSGTFDTIQLGTVSGNLYLVDEGQDYTVIQNNSSEPLILDGASIVLKVDGVEKFRIGDPVGGKDSILHNYGDSLPSKITNTNNVGIALSGTGKVIAANAPKAWGVISGTTGTIGLTPETYGVSGVTKNSTGNYTIDFDTDVLSPSLTYIVIPSLYDAGTTLNASVGIQSRTTDSVTFITWSTNISSGSSVDADIQFFIF